ncbi:MAG: hypothetical protein EBV86_00635 [Marivivens sp.]|nr:hypothetical protein [Marivivens sp.]
MAAEYEVNIKLNTQQVERQLKNIDTRTKRTGRMATENINALAKAQDRRARLMNKINELESKGLNVAKLRKQMGKATEELARRRFGSLQQEFRLLTRTLQLEESKLRILRQQQQGFPASPLRGTAAIPGSPAQVAASARAGGPRSPIGGAANIAGSPAARKARRKTFEQVGLGAGFPLLFGGGAGSVLGGALGGLTGSFGAQIAFSAIGQQIDQFVAGMVDAGKALTSVGSAADFMAEKSLFSSDSMQFRIEKLIEEGQVTEAAALMTQEMAKQVGGTGLKALKDLGTEASKMGKFFNTLILQIQAFIAKGLTPLLAAINKVVGSIATNNQFNALMREATGERARQIQEFLKPFTRTVGTRGVRTKDIVSEEGKRLAVEKFGGQVIPEGAAIEPTQLELLRSADALSRDAGREARAAAKKAERQQLKDFLELNKQMTAELDRQDEINAMNGKHIAEQLNMADKINASQEKRSGLLEARLTKTEKEFRLKQAIEEIQKKGLLRADEDRLIQAEKQIHAMEEQVKVMNEQERLFTQIGQTVKAGLVDGIMSAIDGTKSLSESLSGVLRQLASMFMQVGISSLGKSLKIPGFADGGNPPVGRPSLVGERGPELFVPRSAGTIVPNHALGGANIVVNVDASGTQAQGDQPNAKALGSAIGAAVQAELVRQKRPGGLLSS